MEPSKPETVRLFNGSSLALSMYVISNREELLIGALLITPITKAQDVLLNLQLFEKFEAEKYITSFVNGPLYEMN